jgi:ATP-dependent protease ClpP protease subunit
MKRALIVLLAVMLSVGVAWAENQRCLGGACIDDEAAMKEGDSPASICPKTLISDNDRCFNCHTTPNFIVKEAAPNEGLRVPNGVILHGDTMQFAIDGEIQGYLGNQMMEAFDWAERHNIKHVIVELHSPGGSLLDAWRIVGIMNKFRDKFTMSTECYGFAASAAFIIFEAGDIGRRFVSPTAEMMTHELWTVAFLKLETPSSKEAEAEVMRHLQDTIHTWMAKRCSMTKEELDERTRHVDFWMRGAEAVDMGFADGVIGSEGLK